MPQDQVKDYMIKDVIYVQKGDTVRHLLKVFIDNRIGSVPVIDEEQHLTGIVSDGDVLRTLAPKDQEVGNFFLYTYTYTIPKPEVRDVINTQLDKTLDQVMIKKRKTYYVHAEDEIKEVFKILSKHPVKKIPVVDNNDKVIGVINRGNMMRYVAERAIEE